MPWLTPEENAPVGTICRTLNIPNDIGYLTAVTGALLELTKAHNWEQHGDATPDEVSALMLQMFLDFTASECNPAMTYPTYFLTHAASFIGGASGTLTILFTSAYHGVNAAEMIPAAQFNDMYIPFYCQAGQYDIVITGQKGTNFGITKLSIDGTSSVFLSPDWYSTSAQNNQGFADRVTITGDGMHFLYLYCDTKRAASTGYRFLINSFQGQRVGA